jgi:osmoprotectant transport system permease protein
MVVQSPPHQAIPLAWLLVLGVAVVFLLIPGCARQRTLDGRPVVVVGSKAFTESAILGEMLGQLARNAGAYTRHRARLGDTTQVWNGLLVGDIDVYCEYTGTLMQDILSEEALREQDLPAALERHGLRMSRPLGFNNTYALGMKRTRAEALGIRTISDLRQHPELRLVLSNPFLIRVVDGWPGVKKAYDLPFATPRGVEHDYTYQALENGSADVTDLYATDAAILGADLQVLVDDKHFFPPYQAVLVYRADLAQRAPEVVAALRQLEGKIDEPTMTALNARVDLEHVSEAEAAAAFLRERLGLDVNVVPESPAERVLGYTGEHLLLVSISLTLAVLLAIPLGVVAARRPRLGQVILTLVGIVQTIPGLAFLALLVLVTRQLGAVPVIIALTCYALLPIVRNTYAGLHDIPLSLRESAAALGLSPWARLRLVELPLAARSILAGVKTAAVINVGYATLGALLGAGGYGTPILAGLNKRNPALILEGAIPAVLLALAVQGLFDIAERWLVSPGLRLKAAGAEQ